MKIVFRANILSNANSNIPGWGDNGNPPFRGVIDLDGDGQAPKRAILGGDYYDRRILVHSEEPCIYQYEALKEHLGARIPIYHEKEPGVSPPLVNYQSAVFELKPDDFHSGHVLADPSGYFDFEDTTLEDVKRRVAKELGKNPDHLSYAIDFKKDQFLIYEGSAKRKS